MNQNLNLFFFVVIATQLCLAEKMSYYYVGSLPTAPGENKGRSTLSSSYYFSSTPTDWSNAWFTCQQVMKGNLLSIESPTENTFIKDMMIRENRDKVWTSGAYDAGSRLWRWVSTGSPIVSSGNWASGEPIGTSPLSRVVVRNDLFSNAWITLNANETIYSICEV